MRANFHTHTDFCDGKNTSEEVVLYAIDNGFSSIGFSSHGHTPFDLRYCMTDTDGYIKTISNLKEKYKDKIQIYLGIEEDAFSYVHRENFDYLIGSSHYFLINGEYRSVDSDSEYFNKCLKLFDDDIIKLSDSYYKLFCEYILKRKPDIVGHFDLITKFDEIDTQQFLCNDKYLKLSEKYMKEALKSDCIFEVNTGAMARGIKSTPYPYENLLYVIKKQGGKIMLSSDSHQADTLDFAFCETKKYLSDIGFQYTYVLYNNEFVKDFLV